MVSPPEVDAKRRYFAYTGEKKPVNIKTGQSSGWNQADMLDTFDEARAFVAGQSSPLQLGLWLDADDDLVCIDIDEPVPSHDITRILEACNALFGEYGYYLERSISSKGLHLFVRVENASTLFPNQSVYAFGYRADLYTQHQGILITQNTLSKERHIQQVHRLPFIAPSNLEAILEPRRLPSPRKPAARNGHSSLPEHKNRKVNLFLEMMHLFPQFYRPFIEPYIHHETEDKIYLTRPGKPKSEGVSATLFKDTGIVYNFSTNWEALTPNEGMRLYHAICQIYEMDYETLGRIFHRFLLTLSENDPIPITLPKRKQKRYITLKKRFFIASHILLVLTEGEHAIQDIQNSIHERTLLRPDRTTILRILEELVSHKLAQKRKINRRNLYTITPYGNQLLQLIKQQNYDIGILVPILQTIIHKKYQAPLKLLVQTYKPVNQLMLFEESNTPGFFETGKPIKCFKTTNSHGNFNFEENYHEEEYLSFKRETLIKKENLTKRETIHERETFNERENLSAVASPWRSTQAPPCNLGQFLHTCRGIHLYCPRFWDVWRSASSLVGLRFYKWLAFFMGAYSHPPP